jgi:hypothetical protein
MRQEDWRRYIDIKYRHGIPASPINRPTRVRKGSIMARTIKLPPRSNAISYDDAEVADILITLAYGTPAGEGVVVDDATDTEPKARVRCRNVSRLLKAGVTVEWDALSEEAQELLTENDIEPEFPEAGDDDPDDGGTVTLAGIETRTHVVADGDTFLPVLSTKPAAKSNAS